MKLLILSDLHLEFRTFGVPPVAFDAVILAGDIHNPGSRGVHWARRESTFAGKPVFYVPGNHEFYGREMRVELKAMRLASQGSQVQVLDRQHVDVGRIRILGCTLWTDFELPVVMPGGLRASREAVMDECRLGMNDYFRIRHRDEEGGALLTPQATRQIHWRQRQWLAQQLAQPWAGPTVVVTHHAPHAGSIAPDFANDCLTPAFVSELPPAMFEGVNLWVHGHTHTSFDYRVGELGVGTACRVVCNPRGYPLGMDGRWENERFDGGLVIEV